MNGQLNPPDAKIISMGTVDWFVITYLNAHKEEKTRLAYRTDNGLVWWPNKDALLAEKSIRVGKTLENGVEEFSGTIKGVENKIIEQLSEQVYALQVVVEQLTDRLDELEAGE